MKLVRLWLLLVRNSNWRIRYNMEGGSISNRLFYCYTVSFYEKAYCLFNFFVYLSKWSYLLLMIAMTYLDTGKL